MHTFIHSIRFASHTHTYTRRSVELTETVTRTYTHSHTLVREGLKYRWIRVCDLVYIDCMHAFVCVYLCNSENTLVALSRWCLRLKNVRASDVCAWMAIKSLHEWENIGWSRANANRPYHSACWSSRLRIVWLCMCVPLLSAVHLNEWDGIIPFVLQALWISIDSNLFMCYASHILRSCLFWWFVLQLGRETVCVSEFYFGSVHSHYDQSNSLGHRVLW